MRPMLFSILAGLSAFATPALAAPNRADASAHSSTQPPETPHLAFVREFVREVEENEEILERTSREMAASTNSTDKLTATILAGERTILALQIDEDQLKSIRLRGEFQDLPALIIHAYDRKIELTQRVMVMAATAISDPNPEIGYRKLTGEGPTLAASAEIIDKALFQTTGLVVSTIIDRGEDKTGHLRRLTITRADRQQLIDDLASHLEDKINQIGQGYTMASASLIKGLLLDRKCTDDP